MELRSNYETVWDKCISICLECIEKGVKLSDEISTLDSCFQRGREEFVINSRYLHRGFYCPSPVREYIVTNMRRGKIAKRITKASRITNRYVFDTENKMRIAETHYPNGYIKTEHILYDGNTVCGFTFDSCKHISEISMEWFADGRISSYFWACCWYEFSTGCYRVSHMTYETYSYDNKFFLDMEFYDMLGERNDLGNYNKYRFSLDENGIIIADSIHLLNYDTREQDE